MKWGLLLVMFLVGCGKVAVPVENPSMTYLEASKVVEDEEKELAKLEAKRAEAEKTHDEYTHAIAQSFKGTGDELTAELTRVEKEFRATTLTYANKLVERQQAKVDRARRERDLAKGQD